MQTNYVNSRLGFQVALELLAKLGYSVESANPTQSFVRSEVALSTAVANYHVPLIVNDLQNGSLFPTEKRVELQDVFVPLEMGLFVSVPASATAGALKLYTYENPLVFSTAGASAALTNLWAGRFNMVVNNNQVLPAWDLWKHYKVQKTQQASAVGYSASTITQLDSIDGTTDGFYPVAPSFVMNGAANIQANITLPAAIGTIQSNSRLVVIFRGILLQNVTTVK